MLSPLRHTALAASLLKDLGTHQAPSLPDTVATIISDRASTAPTPGATTTAPSMPEPFPDVTDVAKLLISSCPPDEVVRGISATVSNSLGALKPEFPPETRHLVGAQFLLDSTVSSESREWRSLYRTHAQSIAILEPYGLAGAEFAALAAARAAQSDPNTPNIVIVPALPELISYDGLGHLVARGGLLIDHNGSIHSGLFPTPILCSTVAPGSQVSEFAPELKKFGVTSIGSPEALQHGFSKFNLKKLLSKAGVHAPRAILVTDPEYLRIKREIRNFVHNHPRHRGIVVKPDSEAHGTGVTIFQRGASLERVIRAAQHTVQQFGSAVIEERTPSFSGSSKTGVDSNFRILRAPGESAWVGIEIRAGGTSQAVNLHTGASAYRFTPATIAHLTELPMPRAEALYTRLHNILDNTSKRVADAIGGDLVAIDVIVDNHFVPFVNEAATSMGGGLSTLASLEGSVEERLSSGHELFRSLARRARHDDLSSMPSLSIVPARSHVASSSLKTATYCGLELLTGNEVEHPGVFASALHRCLSQRDVLIRMLACDTYHHHIIEALSEKGLHAHIGHIIRGLSTTIESMPYTLCSLALYAKRFGDTRQARDIIEHLQEKWRPESKTGYLIATTTLKVGASDRGYVGSALRAEAARARPEYLRELKTELGLIPRLNPKTRLIELAKHENDPRELLQEADYWRRNCQYRLSFELVASALLNTLRPQPHFTNTSELLGEVREHLTKLRRYFAQFPAPYWLRLVMTEILKAPEIKPPPLAWIYHRALGHVRAFFGRRALRAILKDDWNERKTYFPHELVAMLRSLLNHKGR